MSDNTLFYEGDLETVLINHSRQITVKVDNINKDQLLATPEDDLAEHIISEMEIIPLTLHEESMVMDQQDIKIDVSGNWERNLSGRPGPGLVYVTAFPDRSTMGKYLLEISWETEVWVAESPTHLIHFDGDRFLGPYDK